MALVDSFPAEPARSRCGDSFATRLVVDGHIPGTEDFGRDLTYEIPAYLAFSQTVDAASDAATLAQVRDVIEQVRLRLLDQRSEHKAWFDQDEMASLTRLLQRADVRSIDAQKLWDKWGQRQGGSFPLWLGDGLDAFPVMLCEFPGQEYRSGRTVYRCPTEAELAQRSVDRELIAEALQEALGSLRCADYHLHRTRLYRQAREIYGRFPGATTDVVATPAPDRPSVATPTDIPDKPAGEAIPDPADLPPEGEGIVVEPDPPAPPQPTLRSRAPQLMIAGGGVLLGSAIVYAVLAR